MYQDFDQATEWTRDEEALHVQRLGRRTILNLETCDLHLPMNVGRIVHVYGEVGHGRSGPAPVITQICGVMLPSAAKVMIHPRSIATTIPSTSP